MVTRRWLGEQDQVANLITNGLRGCTQTHGLCSQGLKGTNTIFQAVLCIVSVCMLLQLYKYILRNMLGSFVYLMKEEENQSGLWQPISLTDYLSLNSTGLHLLLENWDSVMTGSSGSELSICVSFIYWQYLNPVPHRLQFHEQVGCLSCSGLATQPPPHLSLPFAFPFLTIHFPLHLMDTQAMYELVQLLKPAENYLFLFTGLANGWPG